MKLKERVLDKVKRKIDGMEWKHNVVNSIVIDDKKHQNVWNLNEVWVDTVLGYAIDMTLEEIKREMEE